jgi:hypothetical protein
MRYFHCLLCAGSLIALGLLLTLNGPARGQHPPPAYCDQNVQLVRSWYQQYLRREPDAGGLQNFVSLLRQGMTPLEVQASILGSTEYLRLHGWDPAGFVTDMYQDVLGRWPRQDEVAAWLDRLARKRGNRQLVAAEFLWASRGRPGVVYPLR